MFYKCRSLISLPDISKWNTSNVENMESMFYSCSELVNIPNISKWDTKNLKYMNNMFSFCQGLRNKPNISSWFVNNNIPKRDDIENQYYNNLIEDLCLDTSF